MASKLEGSLSAVFAELHSLGLQKRAGRVFTFDASEEFIGWVGLNLATSGRRPGAAAINPVVGIRHQKTERLVADLTQSAFHPYSPPTVSTPIGYLLPAARYREWEIDEDSVDVEARSLGDALRDWGLPFIRRSANLKSVIELSSNRMGEPTALSYRRPIAMALNGDLTASLQDVEKSLEQSGDRTDAAALRFRDFATRFESWAVNLKDLRQL